MIKNKTTIVRAYNPFNPSKDRLVKQVDAGLTIQDYIESNPDVVERPTVCIVNGEPILRSRWQKFVMKANDIVTFFRIPEGGGGGGKDAGSLQILEAGFQGTVDVFNEFSRSVGSAMLSLLKGPSTDQANQLAAPSPTYSLTSQGNTTRVGQSIPAIYGHHQIYPDFATQPYAEFIDNDQYLYHIMVIGQGEYELHKVQIEDTSISDFKEIAWEKIEPGGNITLFDHNVVTSLEVSGQELDGPNLGGDYVGPFIVNPSETTANKIAIDVNLPKGLYSLNDDGSLDNQSLTFTTQARRVNEYGEEVGAWITLGTETIDDNTNTPVRKTYKYVLQTPGRYEVRMKRTSDKSEDSTIANDIRWVGAKAYLTDDVDYGGITMLAVKMKATDNLSNRASRKINCLVTRKIPTWNPTSGWSNPTPTSSICWAVADMLKSEYGAKMDDSKIDLQGFYDLDRTLSDRGDYLNAVFDRKISLWEALKLACRTGRCAGILQGGVFRIIRDRPQSIPTAMFSSRNIVKNTFSVAYNMANEDTADGITVEFINSSTWKPEEISVDHEGKTPTNPARVKFFGCTNSAQAEREALYLARNNIYRRKTISLTTELEGYIPTFGDLVIVSHDMPRWGISGDIVGVNSEGSIVLSEPVDFNGTGKHYIAFRTRSGGVSGPWEVTPGYGSNEVSLSGVWSREHSPEGDYTDITDQNGEGFRLYYGTKEERTHFSFGASDKWSQYGVVKSIRPRGDLKVDLKILSEDNRVHTD